MCLALTVLAVSAANSLLLGQTPSATTPDTTAGTAQSLGSGPPAAPLAPAGAADGRQGETAETQPAPEVSNLGAAAGGAAGTTAALPTLQGDTTWGGRPAFPQVIAPAMVPAPTPSGVPILNDNVNHLAFSTQSFMGIPGFIVDSSSLPASLKTADLVVGSFAFSSNNNLTQPYVPFSAMLLSSPIIGYDMINWAENGAILPQDRVFFDYRHFDAVGSVELVNIQAPDPQNGHPNAYYQQQEYLPLSVDRYCLGFEKTFGGGQWSIEARFPFQGQATASQTFGPGESLQNSVSVGNIGLALKRYLVQGERWNITGGLGLQLPTAPATNLTFEARDVIDFYGITANLHEILNVKQSNETVWLNPFLGVCYDAHNRLFAQAMFQLCVPLNPSSATLTTSVPDGTIVVNGLPYWDFNQTPLNQTTNIAMAFETLFRTNASVGCWLYQDPNRKLSSIAAMIEVDDTNALGNRFTSNVVDLGPQLTVNVGSLEICTGMLVPVTGDEAYKSEFIFRLNRKF
jgi:hypothetical protein